MPSPSTNAFGISVIHNDVLPLVFVPSASMYNVLQFQLAVSFRQPLTGIYSSLTCDGIPLLRLLNWPGTICKTIKTHSILLF